MMPIHVKKGYDLKIEGKPSLDLVTCAKPARVAALPEKIPFIKPKLAVDTGDRVNVGSVLFFDKRNPLIRFLSPGGGAVEQIEFGPRRVIRKIVVALDDTEESESFLSISEKDLENTPREALVRAILIGGLWPLLRGLPFRDIANPEVAPPAIFVSLDATEPFQPEPEVYLAGKTDLFQYGIKVLRKLVKGRIHIAAPEGRLTGDEAIDASITHRYSGCYPAGDPGVILYHIKGSSAENRSWYIHGQDLLLLAQLLKTGMYPTERIIALAGDAAENRSHVKTRIGVPISHIIGDATEGDADIRPIVGGVFTGYTGDRDSFIGFYETALTLINRGDQREFLGFVRPGFWKNSYSRAFLSSFNRSDLKMDCSVHGDVRACVACGSCNRICPVDILPQLTFKAILADDVDDALSHGMLDCAECGLCTYVCPSKIELAGILKGAKMAYFKEQA
ncbi:MAG: Na(+)-translocating NADH-quinone reductase subunit A [Desulfobacterales bacterium]